MNGAVYLCAMETAPNGGSLLTDGSFEDLRKLGLIPVEGMRLQFYDFDADDEGRATYLFCQGVLHFDQGHGVWYALVDQESFRTVPVESCQ